MLKKGVLAVVSLLLLAACSNKNDELSAEERQNLIDEGTVGFEMAGGIIKKAENIPENEEKAILSAFDEYIESFNKKEIDRFMQTLSKNPDGFDLEKEEEYMKNVFEQYDIKRSAEDITITEYTDQQAQVHSKITTHLLQIGTDVQHDNVGKQVTVFAKEDGAWKVTSTYYVGDDSASSTGQSNGE